jgi:transcription elongation factor Elf1
MDTSRNDLLGEIAGDAALERSDFIVQATEQLRKFLNANKERINELGGLVLIDDDPDYLSIAPDLTFRSRTRYLDDLTGDWTSETEVIENASELIELYNPADIYQAFADAAREGAGLEAEPTAEGDLLDTAGIGADETVTIGAGDPYAAAADEWAATQPEPVEVEDDELAAQRLYDLALEFQERSQRSEARLLEQFEDASSVLIGKIGDLIVNDDEDERLTLTASGEFRAEVLTEEENEWRPLTTAEELVEYYDPTDVFGDLADALAEAFPSIAPEIAAFEGEGEAEGEGEEAVEGAAGAADGDADDDGDDDEEGGDEAAPAEGSPDTKPTEDDAAR